MLSTTVGTAAPEDQMKSVTVLCRNEHRERRCCIDIVGTLGRSRRNQAFTPKLMLLSFSVWCPSPCQRFVAPYLQLAEQRHELRFSYFLSPFRVCAQPGLRRLSSCPSLRLCS